MEDDERLSRRFAGRFTAPAVWALVSLLLAATVAHARPERIRAGHSYYSDDMSLEGGVRDLAEEKNYEEVYQSYRYYEAVYDDEGRVVVFKQFERGELVREDRYRYAVDDAAPVEHVVLPPGLAGAREQVDSSE